MSERVVDHYDSVSQGQFCIESDEDGECITWEERFKDVPVYVQEDSGEVDEDGDPILVDVWVDVDYEQTRDVYLSPQEIMEAQGPQVKNWVRAGARVREDLEPVEVEVV